MTLTVKLLEKAIPIYRQYQNDREAAKRELQTMMFYDTKDPNFHLQKGHYRNDKEYEAAKQKHNAQRAADHKQAMKEIEIKIQKLDETIAKDLEALQP